jgi:mRNA-degrading endonuclease YafQ of YafQ-DinJ toxin-antitoxin module
MEVVTKSRFEKDIKKLKKRGKDFSKLEAVLKKLILNQLLAISY